MIEFEWDEAKRRRNIEKHGIDFEDAKAVLEISEERVRIISARKAVKHERERYFEKINDELE